MAKALQAVSSVYILCKTPVNGTKYRRFISLNQSGIKVQSYKILIRRSISTLNKFNCNPRA